MGSTTSSFRISDDLRIRLDKAARRMKKRKNWIINQALREYLAKTNRQAFIEEARRQSILASSVEWPDQEFWERCAAEAIRGWR